jgi:hypothetical protein
VQDYDKFMSTLLSSSGLWIKCSYEVERNCVVSNIDRCCAWAIRMAEFECFSSFRFLTRCLLGVAKNSPYVHMEWRCLSHRISVHTFLMQTHFMQHLIQGTFIDDDEREGERECEKSHNIF